MRPVSAEMYKVLIQMMKGSYKKAVRERSPLEKNAAVLLWRHREKLTLDSEDVLLYNGKEVATKESMKKIVKKSRSQMNGGGARSIAYNMKGRYEGVSERKVRSVLGKSRLHGEIQAKFNNKAPLRFIQANRVFDRVQVDLMSMPEIQSGGQRFRYILTVVDVMSRYLFCRPLKNKSAEHVAGVSKEIFDEHGWPKSIQCDNGPEFLGDFANMCRDKSVKIVKGRPYHPQSQGKVERQNRIVRNKLRYQMCRRGNRGLNWAENVQKVANSINLQPKEVLGYQTPFSVYFGRSSNKSADEIRKCAVEASQKCNQRTYAGRIRKNQCSIYKRGDNIFVRYPFGQRVPYKRHILKGQVLKRGRGFSRYKVVFRKPDRSLAIHWVGVENITSRTIDAEKRRKARAYSLFKELEKKRQHRQKYYLTIEEEPDEINEPRSDNETEDQMIFAGKANIRIVEDPREVGNCQFIAVSDQIKQIGIYRSGRQLREMAIDHIRRGRDHYKNFVSGSIDRYIQQMTNTRTFGDNITLVALARELNCQFIVINSQGPSYHRIISNTGVYDQELTSFTLGFYPEIHYVSVRITDENTLLSVINCCQHVNISGAQNSRNYGNGHSDSRKTTENCRIDEEASHGNVMHGRQYDDNSAESEYDAPGNEIISDIDGDECANARYSTDDYDSLECEHAFYSAHDEEKDVRGARVETDNDDDDSEDRHVGDAAHIDEEDGSEWDKTDVVGCDLDDRHVGDAAHYEDGSERDETDDDGHDLADRHVSDAAHNDDDKDGSKQDETDDDSDDLAYRHVGDAANNEDGSERDETDDDDLADRHVGDAANNEDGSERDETDDDDLADRHVGDAANNEDGSERDETDDDDDSDDLADRHVGVAANNDDDEDGSERDETDDTDDDDDNSDDLADRQVGVAAHNDYDKDRSERDETVDDDSGDLADRHVAAHNDDDEDGSERDKTDDNDDEAQSDTIYRGNEAGFSINLLPDSVLRQIFDHTIRTSPMMRYTLQRVSQRFAYIVGTLGYPQIYLRPSQTVNLPNPISVVRLSRIYGSHSGLMLRIRHILSESGGRWFRAWLFLEEARLGWYNVVNVTWK